MPRNLTTIAALILAIVIFLLVLIVKPALKPPLLLTPGSSASLDLFLFSSYANSAEASASLSVNKTIIAQFSPSWYRFDPNGLLLGKGFDPKLIGPLLPQTEIIPLLANNDPTINGPSSALAHSLFVSPAAQETLIKQAISQAREHHFVGYALDLEGLSPQDGPLLNSFLRRFHQSFTNAHLTLYLCLPGKTGPGGSSWSGAFDYQSLSPLSDYFIIMAYNQSWSTSPPGPIESNTYLRRVIHYSLGQLPPEKIVIGLSLYGLDWDTTNNTPAQVISTSDITALPLSPLTRQDGAVSAQYLKANSSHIIWYDDPQSLKQKIDTAVSQGISRFAFWSLGREDPQTWSLLGRTYRFIIPGDALSRPRY